MSDLSGVDSVMENGEVISEQCIVNDKMKINSEVGDKCENSW